MENSKNAPKIIGAAGVEGQSSSIQQAYPDTCAIRSQEIILRDFKIAFNNALKMIELNKNV